MNKKTAKQPVCPYCGKSIDKTKDGTRLNNDDIVYSINAGVGFEKVPLFECSYCGKTFKCNYELTFVTERI